MNITSVEVDVITRAAEAVADTDPALSEDLLSIADDFWGSMEPTPPIYDGPYGPDNPAPGTLA